jgi:predicted TIM-barrel fold metal-dependent hydrolase
MAALTAEARERIASPGKGLGIFNSRVPMTRRPILPKGTVVVSSDNHYPVVEDIWYPRFPAHLKSRAFRIWWDEEAGINQMGLEGKPMFANEAIPVIKSMEDHPGSRNVVDRMKDLDAEGVDKEILYPQILGSFFKYPDFEAREWTYRIYNEYLAELQAKVPGRMYGVAVGNYWDPVAAVEWVKEVKRLGLKTLMFPLTPGTRPDGKTIYYSSPEYDPMWEAVQDSGLVVAWHVGEQLNYGDSPAASAPVFLSELGPSKFRGIFGELVFGRVLDRFPGLKIVFAEANLNWIPGLIQDAEMMYNSHARLFKNLPEHSPEYYWRKNFYATFIADVAGLHLIDMIGRDRVMFSTDYPHNEGTYGYTADAIDAVTEVAHNDDEIRAILGGTAIKLYGLD